MGRIGPLYTRNHSPGKSADVVPRFFELLHSATEYQLDASVLSYSKSSFDRGTNMTKHAFQPKPTEKRSAISISHPTHVL